MREIKFRGKTVINGEWVYGSLETFTDDKQNYARIKFTEPYTDEELGITLQRGCDYLVDPQTVGQFTGLHDKNGIEIYEGDVIKVKNLQGVVVFHPNGYYCLHTRSCNIEETSYTTLGDLVDYLHREQYEDGLVIIGNIHDNPELMKGGEK